MKILMNMIVLIVLFTSYLYATNVKNVFFSGFYNGIPVKSEDIKPLKKELLMQIFPKEINFEKAIEESINTYKKVDVSSIGKHKFLSIADSENLRDSIKTAMVSFVSLDDIITFKEITKFKDKYSTRVNIYNLFSFYLIELKSMRVVYSKQYILPMNAGVEGKATEEDMIKLFSSKKELYKDAVTEIVKKSISDSNFVKLLDETSKNANFIKTKNFTIISNRLSKKSKKRISNSKDFEKFTSYAMSSKLSDELSILSPVLYYAIDKDGKYKEDDKYLMQIKSNIDYSLDTLSYKLNLSIDRQKSYKELKVSGNKIKLPLATFPKVNILLNTTSYLVEKTKEKNSIREKKLFAVQHSYKANVLKKGKLAKKIEHSIDSSDKIIGKKKIRYRQKGGLLENIPNSTVSQSDLYFYNASLNAISKSKDKIGDHYDLNCLIRNKCNKR